MVAFKASVFFTFNVAFFLFKVTFVAFFSLETTFTLTVAFLLPAFTVMVALPVFLALIFPFFTVATFLLEVDQDVLSVVSEGVTVAFTLTLLPFTI